MIRDRDRIYGAVVTRRLRAMGIRDKPIAPASPWQNGFAERLIGSIRRECLDHIIVKSVQNSALNEKRRRLPVNQRWRGLPRIESLSAPLAPLEAWYDSAAGSGF
jgi:transposase InsO family protein